MEDIKTVEEIFPKIAANDFFFQIFVGCRYDADINRNIVVAPHRFKNLLLNSSEQLDLGS